MGKKAGAKDVATMIRGAFKRAALAMEDKGKPLSTMMMESLEDNFLATIKAIAPFCPKELDITSRKVQDVSDLTDEELEQIAMVAGSIVGEDGEAEADTVKGKPTQVH